ncbi:Nucleosome-remodeling factor subunit NURF301-like [Frankliniella fusca]|uniref:Nucleosome-remodeling factor subunit NURF301-like n=1 Tax=Frankliniella fusca TaxID=407009 RepID=A0AAE1HNV6_9NEOP|nr:Nucleosome-remodeling factor subunit NURF301-like [Frankliniella fusca]
MDPDLCPMCDNKSNKRFWIWCDFCDVWHHLSCVGLTKQAVKRLNTWQCRKCISEKATTNKGTAHETSPKTAIGLSANSSTYFLTICVCNDLMRNTTTSNIRVSAQCGVCHNHFHVHCIRVETSNGKVLCPNCSCQNHDDMDRIHETVEIHETANISTTALPTQPRSEAVAMTLLACDLPTQSGSKVKTFSAAALSISQTGSEVKTAACFSTQPGTEEITVSPSTPPTQFGSEEITVLLAVPSPTPPSGSEETTVSTVPFPSSSGSDVTRFYVVSLIPVRQTHESAGKHENNDSSVAEVEETVRKPCALRFTSPFPPTTIKRKSLSLSQNKKMKLSASQP